MSNFIGYAAGLECNKGAQIGKLVRVEYSRASDESVRLQAVSARTLGKMAGSRVISSEEFEGRPRDAYNTVVEARWALNSCGGTLMGDE